MSWVKRFLGPQFPSSPSGSLARGRRRSMSVDDAVGYYQLIEINQAAFRAGWFDAAHDALDTALHIAEQLADLRRIQRTKEVAQAQSEWMKDHAKAPLRRPRNGSDQ